MIHTDKGIRIPEFYSIIYITRQYRLSDIQLPFNLQPL